ncbi:UNKNOWN [Stylonychia lemnae]|uniref:Uncharacterized protein n=1 Tax=Stylonychia lemnae TaxID=5949 RepID=A0A078B4M2_STYLE|nr:UNKNOWN [Stylonychia lemnae]|eukprot:CDW89221.1 UNKNOWN [Stylonychia lemnae]
MVGTITLIRRLVLGMLINLRFVRDFILEAYKDTLAKDKFILLSLIGLEAPIQSF